MTNNKKELELMQACKNCDLEKVKSLVEANKYGINTLEKAKSVAQEVSCSEVVDYLENITRKNRGKELIENCRRNFNSGNPEGGMGFDEDINIEIKDDTIHVKNEKGELLSKYNKYDIEKEN